MFKTTLPTLPPSEPEPPHTTYQVYAPDGISPGVAELRAVIAALKLGYKTVEVVGAHTKVTYRPQHLSGLADQISLIERRRALAGLGRADDRRRTAPPLRLGWAAAARAAYAGRFTLAGARRRFVHLMQDAGLFALLWLVLS